MEKVNKTPKNKSINLNVNFSNINLEGINHIPPSTKNTHRKNYSSFTPKSAVSGKTSQRTIMTNYTNNTFMNKTQYINDFKGDKASFIKEIEQMAYIANQKYLELTDKRRLLLSSLAQVKADNSNFDNKRTKLQVEIEEKDSQNESLREIIRTLETEIRDLEIETQGLIIQIACKKEENKELKKNLYKELNEYQIKANKINEDKDNLLQQVKESINYRIFQNKMKAEEVEKRKKELEDVKVSQINKRIIILFDIDIHYIVIYCILLLIYYIIFIFNKE